MELKERIREDEEAFGRRLGEVAEEIAARRPRLIAIAGPSSSGKTTTAGRLAAELATRGLTARPLSLDDYFVDREKTPLDPEGGYDYESLYSLNLDRLHSDLRNLLDGKMTPLPHYDFMTGSAGESGTGMRLNLGDILLIEGLHALNPELTGNLDRRDVFRIYAAPTGAPDSAETRLRRRTLRDSRTRGATPEQTLKRWPSVRAGEARWIDPFIPNADARLDTYLPYEPEFISPAGETPDKSMIPSDSILHEFIG